jgi:hypothetical protein
MDEGGGGDRNNYTRGKGNICERNIGERREG